MRSAASEPVTAPINVSSKFSYLATDPKLSLAMNRGMKKVEKRLHEAVSQSYRVADQTSRHLVEAGGKRVRPMLTLLTAQLGDAGKSEVVEAAVTVELTHLASLYHDDVMDEAPLRRGVPSAHSLWGNNIAILTGDLLFARASLLVSDLGDEALKIQAETFERLCLGQLHETVGPGEQEDPLQHYIEVLQDKTGSLIAEAAHFGVLLSGAPREYIAPLVEFGEKVGVAFQLADDVIDVTAEREISGKTPGTDLREGVATLPVLLLRQQVEQGDAPVGSHEVLDLIDSDLSDDDRLAEAVRQLSAHPVAAQSWAIADQWADAAIEALAPLPKSSVKTALTAFAKAVVTRKN